MRSAIRCGVMAALLIGPAVAEAGPILPNGGTWTAVGTPNKDGSPFWDNQSVDFCGGGQDCNAGQAILFQDLFTRDYDPNDGELQYLHDGSFGAAAFSFDTSVTGWKPEFTITNLTNAFPGQSLSGAITYTNPGPGPTFVYDSLTTPGQFALFRQVGKTDIRYFFAFEDDASRLSDRDYNDLIMSMSESRTAPEPTTLALFGAALLGVGARRLRRRS